MLSLKDLNELLEKIPIWRKMIQAPERIEKLEARIVALEAAAHAVPASPERAPAKLCPFCRYHTADLVRIDSDPVFDKLGGTIHHFKCSNCKAEFQENVGP